MKRSKEIEAILSKLPNGLSIYRLENGRISPEFHNPAFYRLLGYSGDHLALVEREMTFLGVHEEDLPALQAKGERLLRDGGRLTHECRVFNDARGEYRWVRMDGSVHEEDGIRRLYLVYSDVTEQKRLEQETAAANEKMRDIVDAIPGGVAIYKVSDIFETVYYSGGVPKLSGYSAQEYQELVKGDAAELTYWEDTPRVTAAARQVVRTRGSTDIEFRKQHRDGHLVWVRTHIRWIGEEDGCPLLHCVFFDISDLKVTQLEMNHLINSIPGGIASYQLERGRIKMRFVSDGVVALSGHDRAEYEELVREDGMRLVYEADRGRVLAAAKTVAETGGAMEVSCRICHKDGGLFWVHMNGRRMGRAKENATLSVVLTGMSAEARLFQNIANETADGIYVIDQNTYDLLYVNESKEVFPDRADCIGQKCYAALHGQREPCPFCTLKSHAPDGEAHAMPVDGGTRHFITRFREMDWNGIPAYVKYVRDVTGDVETRREKERLEQYFQTLVNNLPGGVMVIRRDGRGGIVPEYLSDGFAALAGLTASEAWGRYEGDAVALVHPDDRAAARARIAACISGEANQDELVCRLMRGDGSWVWVKAALSLIRGDGGGNRVYAVYHDVTRERAEQARLRQRYQDLIVQHYRTPDPNDLILAHCNITRRKILEVIDYTDSDLLAAFGDERDAFFTGLSGLLADPGERRAFLDAYLSAPALANFTAGKTEEVFEGFVKLPKEELGRYVRVRMNMVAAPDSGDVTGILTVTDVTERTISDRIHHQLFVTGYDLVVELDLLKDRYVILSQDEAARCMPPRQGRHSEWTAQMLRSAVLPKDRESYRRGLDPERIRARLEKENAYTFSYSAKDENGETRTKNMTVSAIDLRLGRVSLVRTDITDSVREQQGLLNVIAYTFERMGLVHVKSGQVTLYTRRGVLESLPPEIITDYGAAVERLMGGCGQEAAWTDTERRFRLPDLLARLAEKPAGFDFVLPCRTEGGVRYKQINVLWGDENRQSIYLVRADVTDAFTAERESKRALEEALALAEEANEAKRDFLSTMSHDIRTPLNAIMGMTGIAAAHLGERARVADCLEKISVSSRHLLSLVNDILDMSKIEQGKVTLNRARISLPELAGQLCGMMEPQARAAGLTFETRMDEIAHAYFYGDALRIDQILINLLGNAVKFTPQGGRVEFLIGEIPPEKRGWVRYRFTVRDTGIGMTEEFIAHIFEPFTRSRESARIAGTGLGLSISKALLDLMGGSIAVESRVDQGSTFRVELEFEPAQAGEGAGGEDGPAAPERMERPLAGRCFLVAEDNPINAEILCEILSMNGARFVVRTDGAQAVRAFQEAPPGTYDAVLMDIRMPEMNGYEATRAIRGTDRQDAASIPIIAMTANAFAEDVQAALEAGMNAHLAKPLDTAALLAVLRRALDGR